MKKHAPKPKEDAPLAVAVPSLMPEFYLWNSKTGTLNRVYGGFVSNDPKEDSAYIKGPTHKRYRQAEESERYECEINLMPLPDRIEEVILSEAPECQLLITNCKVLPMPSQQDAKPGQVLKLPATVEYEQRQKEEKYMRAFEAFQKKRKDDNQLLLFPPPEDLRAAG